MKRILLTGILITLNLCLNAQLSIGKETINGASTLLDFDDSASNKKGIILPAVTTLPQSPVSGNFVFDATDSTVKVYEDGAWINLSENGDSTDVTINSSNEIGDGIVIGAESSSAEGVLVLESPNMAMILPKVVEPHLNVKSPYPGMMCYDSTSKSLAVFDGSKWYYWK